jgi:hypothetical protein
MHTLVGAHQVTVTIVGGGVSGDPYLLFTSAIAARPLSGPVCAMEFRRTGIQWHCARSSST